jgi:two-component system response regulator ResD
VSASATATVLVVDDEPTVRRVVAAYLRSEGHRTLEAGDGVAALALFERERPGLVVLDLMLPGIDGLELCRIMRRRADTPIIMLTARGEASDRIVGLDLGADDYLTKPFSPRELVARVRSVLRRARTVAGEGVIAAGRLTIDPGAREVTRDGLPLRLTVKEFDLLHFLAGNPRLVFSREQLMDRVWGHASAYDTGTVTVHVRRLREKIEDDPSRPRHIETVWGAGYRYSP